MLVEPGISDVDHGRWRRKEITCIHCNEARPVWWQLDLMDPMLRADECPALVRRRRWWRGWL
jgi:hypothetical protein